MPLNLNNSVSLPHIRYMAGTSSWMISTEGGVEQFQLPKCVFDLANIQTGWGLFTENAAPEWVWDQDLQHPAAAPADGREWSRGFRVTVLLPADYAPDRLREFATTSVGAKEGIKALYAQYEQEAPNNPGKVPVVEFRGATSATIGKGRTNIPNLVIVDWIDRPADLDKPLEDSGSGAFSEGQSQQFQPPAQQQQFAQQDAAAQPSSQPAANPVQPPQQQPTQPAQDNGNPTKPVF